MEYTLRLTVAPTIHEDQFCARLFVAGDNGERHIGTEQIWETTLGALAPSDRADVRLWCLMLLEEIIEQLSPDVRHGLVRASGKLMEDLFKQEGLFIN